MVLRFCTILLCVLLSVTLGLKTKNFSSTTNLKAASNFVNCGCQCSSLTFRDSNNIIHGNCKRCFHPLCWHTKNVLFSVLIPLVLSGVTLIPATTAAVKIFSRQVDFQTIPGLIKLVQLLKNQVTNAKHSEHQQDLDPHHQAVHLYARKRDASVQKEDMEALVLEWQSRALGRVNVQHAQQ